MIYGLDLQYILVNTLSGNILIFMFLALIFIAGMAAYFRMSGSTTLIMISLFIFMMGVAMETTGLYALSLIIGGVAAFWSIAKLIKT